MTNFAYSSKNFEDNGNDHHAIQQGVMMILQLEAYRRAAQVLGLN